MSNAIFKVPFPKNEPVLSYAPGTKERQLLKKALEEGRSKELDIPMYIGSEEVRTGKKARLSPPHDHKHTLGYYHEGDKTHVEQAIKAALAAKEKWSNLSWE
ncbi:MAG TPA: 1-pyrroline-5-carboxylate dehydrogenase, partial [Cyclobacteriaceae bacterium]|nr:1-pyrroline-5-carboxylate dehydrogenase [Cyclobacteriaceae bacterium]